jgi:hypothetical protein
MFRRLNIAFFAIAVLIPLSSAQIRGARPGSVHGFRGGFGGHHRATSFAGNRGMYWASAFPYQGLYQDYDSGLPDTNDSSSDNSTLNSDETAAPQFMIVRRAVEDAPRKPKAAPLLIEWRGDRYVRFGGVEQTGDHGASAHPDYGESKPLPIESPAVEPPPAVLVYRDGHREEISEYAIANGMIYIQGSDWSDANRTKRIPLSSLDSSATVQANQQRGVKFMLPSASNVVIASF